MYSKQTLLKSSLLVGLSLLTVFVVLAAAPQPAKNQAPDTPAAKLARERLEVADQGYKLVVEQYKQGLVPLSLSAEWARRQAQAHFDVPEATADRVAFLEGYVRQVQDLEKLAESRFRAGVAGQLDTLEAKYVRLEGEMWLARAREQ
ncbi:MAG: hypothetical protein ACHRHE_12715 [Tepidisphaerales bacterium]